MALSRPLVSVYSQGQDEGSSLSNVKATETVVMPAVFNAPLRMDLVQAVHSDMAKNKRQAYGVSIDSGYQTSAASWGTGRAVARVPRVSGGGCGRSAQGAFANFCRGGGMFNPNKAWRRWHRKINLTQKRHALATAIAASGLPPLVMARGHRIDAIPELPLVVSDSVNAIQKTKEAVAFLKSVGCEEEIEKVKASRKIRAGKGKARNRRYVSKKGPLLIYNMDRKESFAKAFRNIEGVDLCHVDRLNLLKLAPGGTLGRLCIWTKSAFERLQALFGGYQTQYKSHVSIKKGYRLQRPMMLNSDLSRLINSEQIQSALRPSKGIPAKHSLKSRFNPLKHTSSMLRLNPAFKLIQKKRLERLTAKPSCNDAKALKLKLNESRLRHKELVHVFLKKGKDAINQYAMEKKTHDS